jgi:hypothetical protein
VNQRPMRKAGVAPGAQLAPRAVLSSELVEAALDVVKWLDSKEINRVFRQAESLILSHPHLSVKVTPEFSEWAAKVLRRFRDALNLAESRAVEKP